jgi:MFS transporter, ACS family, tartrate transporter
LFHAGGNRLAVAPPASETVAKNILADRARRRIAVRLLPFLFILYIVNYLDRTSVAYAAIGMARTLGFNDEVFGFGAGIFFVSYVALQIPGALMVEHWSARRCIALIMIAWGSLTVLTGLVHTPGQLYAARVLLGAAEAGFFPGVVVYLSHWFTRKDRAKAASRFMAAIPLSFIIGSPLAGWILGHPWLGVDGWRWLFALEGLPAILLGAVAFFYLTDWPRDAGWLAPDEKKWIEQKLEDEKSGRQQKIATWQALHSRPILLLAAVAFFEYFVAYTIAFWWPTILKRQSGFSDWRVGLIGALPYVAGLMAMLINGWHSDKTGERRWHSAVPQFIAAVALLALITSPPSTWVSVILFSMLCLVWGFLPVFWTMPSEILSDSAAAASVGLVNAAGSVAGFAGPFAFGYLNTRTGSYSYGLALMIACAVAGGLLVLRVPVGRPVSFVQPLTP